MKQFPAILLIVLFAFSQYEKQITYMECKLANSFRTSSTQCDCEKMGGFASSDTAKLPSQKTNFHTHADDLFTPLKLSKADFPFYLVLIKMDPVRNDKEQDGFPWKYYHPPQV